MSRMMSRRFGSASARRTASVPAGLSVSWSAGIRSPFSLLARPPRSRLFAARLSLTGLDVGGQAGDVVRPTLVAHVVALEFGGEALVAEVDRGAVAGVLHLEHDGRALPVRRERGRVDAP